MKNEVIKENKTIAKFLLYIGFTFMIIEPILIASNEEGFEENVNNIVNLYLLCLAAFGARIFVLIRNFSLSCFYR